MDERTPPTDAPSDADDAAVDAVVDEAAGPNPYAARDDEEGDELDEGAADEDDDAVDAEVEEGPDPFASRAKEQAQEFAKNLGFEMPSMEEAGPMLRDLGEKARGFFSTIVETIQRASSDFAQETSAATGSQTRQTEAKEPAEDNETGEGEVVAETAGEDDDNVIDLDAARRRRDAEQRSFTFELHGRLQKIVQDYIAKHLDVDEDEDVELSGDFVREHASKVMSSIVGNVSRVLRGVTDEDEAGEDEDGEAEAEDLQTRQGKVIVHVHLPDLLRGFLLPGGKRDDD